MAASSWFCLGVDPQTHKCRRKSDLHICDFLWSLNLWSVCYLHLHCWYCSVSDLSQFSAPETGLEPFRNHIWAEYLVNAGRPKPSWAPDLYLTQSAATVEGTEGEKSHHCCMCHRQRKRHWASAVTWQFCDLEFCMSQLSFSESIGQYFTADKKGKQCGFFSVSHEWFCTLIRTETSNKSRHFPGCLGFLHHRRTKTWKWQGNSGWKGPQKLIWFNLLLQAGL